MSVPAIASGLWHSAATALVQPGAAAAFRVDLGRPTSNGLGPERPRHGSAPAGAGNPAAPPANDLQAWMTARTPPARAAAAHARAAYRAASALARPGP